MLPTLIFVLSLLVNMQFRLAALTFIFTRLTVVNASTDGDKDTGLTGEDHSSVTEQAPAQDGYDSDATMALPGSPLRTDPTEEQANDASAPAFAASTKLRIRVQSRNMPCQTKGCNFAACIVGTQHCGRHGGGIRCRVCGDLVNGMKNVDDICKKDAAVASLLAEEDSDDSDEVRPSSTRKRPCPSAPCISIRDSSSIGTERRAGRLGSRSISRDKAADAEAESPVGYEVVEVQCNHPGRSCEAYSIDVAMMSRTLSAITDRERCVRCMYPDCLARDTEAFGKRSFCTEHKPAGGRGVKHKLLTDASMDQVDAPRKRRAVEVATEAKDPELVDKLESILASRVAGNSKQKLPDCCVDGCEKKAARVGHSSWHRRRCGGHGGGWRCTVEGCTAKLQSGQESHCMQHTGAEPRGAGLDILINALEEGANDRSPTGITDNMAALLDVAMQQLEASADNVEPERETALPEPVHAEAPAAALAYDPADVSKWALPNGELLIPVKQPAPAAAVVDDLADATQWTLPNGEPLIPVKQPAPAAAAVAADLDDATQWTLPNGEPLIPVKRPVKAAARPVVQAEAAPAVVADIMDASTWLMPGGEPIIPIKSPRLEVPTLTVKPVTGNPSKDPSSAESLATEAVDFVELCGSPALLVDSPVDDPRDASKWTMPGGEPIIPVKRPGVKSTVLAFGYIPTLVVKPIDAAAIERVLDSEAEPVCTEKGDSPKAL